MNRLVFSGLLIAVAAASAVVTQKFLLADDTRQNVARGKPTSMSSQNGGGGDFAVDGHTDGREHFFHTGLDDNAWWMVDLGAVYSVSGFELHNRTDCCGERAATLSIQVSKDAKVWTTVYTHDKKPFGDDFSDVPPLKVSVRASPARYVRVQLSERNYLHLAEVRVLGVPQ